ncbi:hypothetical protein NA57DRAFT_53682 [Rhizodiscina lignyota]|uniref:FAD-binding domain-containing protein n=1 Tax=Rhizodiscina lignyota TaxID=1504668 RepID=A0A9P4INN1_9PEZI|nr:hypothetical protein NA57DRAFT_53682 [Rhizodiscina lignyota]
MDTDIDILIVGGGPVGMMAAYMFAHLGQRCTLIEQSTTTTIYPKMELSNHRTMEIHRQIGLLERVRAKAVPEQFDLDEIISTGYGEHGKAIHTWTRESPAALRQKWAKINNGAYPLEPYMRQNQITFEALMKSVVQSEPLIDDRWGFTFKSLKEEDEAVIATVIDPAGKEIQIKSKYLIGCDGGGSGVRKSAGIISPRDTLPFQAVSVHFKSKEASKLLQQGHYWHMMFLNGAALINQDEGETWTFLQSVPPDADLSAALEALEPRTAIYQSLGGLGQPFNFHIDEILTQYKWKSDLAIAESFRSAKGRVLLAGDAAHQLSPVGGHGMNSGIQDVYGLSWKLVAVLRGYGGDALLDSYSFERRKTAQLNRKMVEKATHEVALPIFTAAITIGAERLMAEDEEAQKIREGLKAQFAEGHWLHGQNGIYIGYRYNGSPIIVPDQAVPEPAESVTELIPTTWPGSRAPHVFLKDGKTSIFDLYGSGFTIVDFTPTGSTADQFLAAAKSLDIPISKVHIPEEKHCRDVWERDVVLVRPDGFVAWRVPTGNSWPGDLDAVTDVLRTAVGKSS